MQMQRKSDKVNQIANQSALFPSFPEEMLASQIHMTKNPLPTIRIWSSWQQHHAEQEGWNNLSLPEVRNHF